MLLRNGVQPWHLLVVALVAILVFGSKKLPDTARSLGKSLRILKSETRAMKDEEASAPGASPSAPTSDSPTDAADPPPSPEPVTLQAAPERSGPHRPGPP